MPAVITARLALGIATWAYIVTIWYDGEPFDYVYDCGSSSLPERVALDYAKAEAYDRQSWRAFMASIQMESKN